MENNGKPDLVWGRYCGTKSRRAYETWAEIFGWNQSHAGQFEWGGSLYAPRATPERYSVWFVAHSNFVGDRVEMWENEISDDEEVIREYWKDHLSLRGSDNAIRVVFARRLAGQDYATGIEYMAGYYFLGIYKPDAEAPKIMRKGETAWVKTYRRISCCYPPVKK